MVDGGTDEVGSRLERRIEELLDARAATSSICPSDAARAEDADGWRDLMPAARDAAGRLAARGAVQVTQRGEVVDVATARGPGADPPPRLVGDRLAGAAQSAPSSSPTSSGTRPSSSRSGCRPSSWSRPYR